MVIKTTDNLPSTELQDFPFEIPESWVWVTLSNITSKITDGSHNPPPNNLTGIPILSAANIFDGEIQFLSASRWVSEEQWEIENKRTEIQINDILLTIVGTIGRTAIVKSTEKFALQRSVAVLKPIKIYSGYISYVLQSSFLLDLMVANSKGTAQKGIYLNSLKDLVIPIPPLNEQKRIVAKIEELLPYIEQYAEKEEKLTTLHQQFPEQLKKSILQAAIQGKLTKQDPNDEPALVLIERIKAEKLRLIDEKKLKKPKVVSEIILRDNLPYEIINGEERCIADEIPFDIPENWCWVRLGKIGETNIGLTYTPNDVVLEGTIVLRSGNIQNGKIDVSSDVVRVNLNIPENKKCYKNDLLICARNGSKNLVGKAAIVDKDGYSFGAFMAIFRSPFYQYIYYYLSSPLFRNDFDGINTTTINQITQNNLNNRLIPLPPLNEQKRIVEKIETLFSALKNLEYR
ncbi:restriction endonuclease subunit S [Actinobacillus equuli]|uniref:restriction endonuclease subunit S n=1 Tax=Actinobacillus equuli TaxID=718 RepID=UPI002442E8FF|nr:restriction endonuclease subunit S [Actinobacillus equuli]WGE52804.1 restriction endonuclease subunit S [Actinobacillus equuli subsp. haemolyticus]WGE73247.1 restriction endonuclease subunit S [Actinobacillus equuli subsp. haemolyticus]